MKNMTTKEFCEKYEACDEGTQFALNYANMRECYNALLNGEAGNNSASWAIWVATQKDVFSARDLRLFAVKCDRRVQHLMKDRCHINALDVAERYANGEATDAELQQNANDAAVHAAADAAHAAHAAAHAAEAEAYAAEAEAYAARAAAYAAAYYKERYEQLKILAEFGNPFSEDEE